MFQEDQQHPNFYKEGEPRSTDLQIIQTPDQSIGVFTEYGDEIIQAICEEASHFSDSPAEDLHGHRDKFFFSVRLADGSEKKFIGKSKYSKIFGMTAVKSTAIYRGEIERASEFDQMLIDQGLQPGVDTPLSSETRIRHVKDAIRNESALNEVLVSRKAAFRYKQAYGEELPLEKAVGFVVDRSGRKWTVFEFIDNIVSLHDLPGAEADVVEQKAYEFAQQMSERLQKVGIVAQDLLHGWNCKNVEFTGDVHDINSLTPILVDTEEWHTVPSQFE